MPDCKHAKTAIQRVLKSCAECDAEVIHKDVKPIRVPEPMSEARLAEIEIDIEGESRSALYLAARDLVDEVRRLRDRENDEIRQFVDDVLAHPGKYPEIEARARELMGQPETGVSMPGAITVTGGLTVSGSTTLTP